jgi:TRAP-type transport system small permease protein
MSEPNKSDAPEVHSGGATGADKALGSIAAVVLFSMMVMTFIDVLGRKFFNAPLNGAFELTELGMVVLIYAGLPLVSLKEEHVEMDFIDRIFPALKRAVRVAVNALIGLLLLGLAYRVTIKAGRVMEAGDTTASLKIALGPFAYLIAILIAITALIHFYKMFTPVPQAHHTGTV